MKVNGDEHEPEDEQRKGRAGTGLFDATIQFSTRSNARLPAQPPRGFAITEERAIDPKRARRCSP